MIGCGPTASAVHEGGRLYGDRVGQCSLHTCKLVLHVLQLVEVFLGDAIEERVAIVDSSADDAASDRLSHLACQVTSDVATSSDVIDS